jgi:uncharacterized protein
LVDVTPAIPAGKQLIESYGDGRFRVSGVVHRGSVLVLRDTTLAWPIADMADLTEASLQPVMAAGSRVDLLLIGCGPRQTAISQALRQRLRQAGIVVEVMGTGAACRTYNVLLAEGRMVAAALIAVE